MKPTQEKTSADVPVTCRLRMKARKPVFGLGVNDADYNVCWRVGDKRYVCPYYSRWKHIFERCYSKLYLERFPSYIGCSVCEEWHLFSNFKRWMEQQDWKGKVLDKDILVQGNKVYSPHTCVFVDSNVNILLTDAAGRRGEWPLGVSFIKAKDRFVASVAIDGKNKSLGHFFCPKEAHRAWQKGKAEVIKNSAAGQIDERVRDALLLRVAQLEADLAAGVETLKL